MLKVLWLSFLFLNYETHGAVMDKTKESNENIQSVNPELIRYSQQLILVPTEDIYKNSVGFDGEQLNFGGLLKAIFSNSDIAEPVMDYDPPMSSPFDVLMPLGMLYIQKKQEIAKSELQNFISPSGARTISVNAGVDLPDISITSRADKTSLQGDNSKPGIENNVPNTKSESQMDKDASKTLKPSETLVNPNEPSKLNRDENDELPNTENHEKLVNVNLTKSDGIRLDNIEPSGSEIVEQDTENHRQRVARSASEPFVVLPNIQNDRLQRGNLLSIGNPLPPLGLILGLQSG